MNSLFLEYWLIYSNKPLGERKDYFNSLTRRNQEQLVESFYDGRWHELFIQDFLDLAIIYIKNQFDINLISLRIQAIKFNRVFLIDRKTWDFIEHVMFLYSGHYDTDKYFGGLKVQTWGRKKQFYRISAIHNKWR